MSPLKRVLIVGGTHGNELIGISLVQKFERQAVLLRRPSFETLTLLGNPAAIAAGTRYLDQDLNRCFAAETLAKTDDPAYEVGRAQAIHRTYGPGGQTPVDLIVDLHGTTANAGQMLILDSLDHFTLALAAHLSLLEPAIKVYSSADSGRKRDSLRSLAPYRLGIEVGPVAHGTLQAQLFGQTEALVLAVLDYLEAYSSGTPYPAAPLLTLYQYVGALDYPRSPEGALLAMIHPERQGQDYQALHPGDPLFITFEGDPIAYDGPETVYPVFINEAAYYEKGIALCLTQKQTIVVKTDAVGSAAGPEPI
jgi:succinylglutamate desuccinylase